MSSHPPQVEEPGVLSAPAAHRKVRMDAVLIQLVGPCELFQPRVDDEKIKSTAGLNISEPK